MCIVHCIMYISITIIPLGTKQFHKKRNMTIGILFVP